jgi:hypothetical protein
MGLIYSNEATNNKFANKHLHVVGGAPTLMELVDIGRDIFEARVRAYKQRRKKTVSAQALKARYGSSTEVTRNTLLVLNTGGLAGLTAAITNNGYASGWYEVKNGVIFNTDEDDNYTEGLIGKLNLGIRPVAGGGAGNYEVWHLDGAVISAVIGNGTDLGYNQIKVKSVGSDPSTLGLAYAPTTAELNSAISTLKKVGPPKVSGKLPTVALGVPVDLSFLDDDD